RQRAQARRGRGLVHEVKSRLAGLRNERSDPLHDEIRAGFVVPTDVVEGDIAEGTLLPIAPMRERDFVPAPVRPEPMHRVEHLEQRYVLIERQSIVGWNPGIPLRNVMLTGVIL